MPAWAPPEVETQDSWQPPEAADQSPPPIEELRATPTIGGELESGRIGNAVGIASRKLSDILGFTEPSSALQKPFETGHSLLGTSEKIPYQEGESQITRLGKAAINVGNEFLSGATSPEGITQFSNPVTAAVQLAQIPLQTAERIREAEATPAGSAERWEAGLSTVGLLATPAVAHALPKLGETLFPDKTAPAFVPKLADVIFAKDKSTTTAAPLATDAIRVITPDGGTATEVADHPTIEVPLDQITLSKDVPQFKAGANEKGIVEPIAGKYERVGTAPVQIWQRNDGSMELISGRHRLDLAQRTGEETIPAQIHKESDGFTAPQAAMLDAELNIRDNQGSTADYANYFKNSGIDQAAADSRGLLARAKGKAGFSIANAGSEDLFALHQSGRLTDSQAEAIATAAPNNPGAQQVGIRAALDGRSAEFAGNLIKAATSRAPTATSGDLFSFDDAAMKEMEAQARRASEEQRGLREQISAVQGAAKKPEIAAKLGVDVKDPVEVQRRVLELKSELARWDNWPTDPELVAKTRGEPPPPAPEVTPTLRPGENQGDLLARQTEDLALVGEHGTDFAARQAAAEESARAKAESDATQQTKLFADFQSKTEPPSAQAVGLLPKPSEFVKQDVAKIVGTGVKAVRQIKSILTPANVSELSGETARVIRENAAELARKKEIAGEALKSAAKLLSKNDVATNIDIIDRLETGKDLGNAGLDAYKQARAAAYEERINQVRAVNPDALSELIDNYFPHIWTEESRAKLAGNLDAIPNDNAWARIFGKRPLEGTKGFLKQRAIPTTAEGIAIGLEPVTTNPVMLDLLKMHEMDRYVMGQKIMGELKERGIAQFVRAGEKAPDGYVQINDRMAKVMAPPDWKIVDAEGKQVPGQKVLGNYYAPEDAARVLNNYLSPGLRGFAPYDAFRFVGNMMNQVQLGFSLYHATFTAIDAATSTLSLGLEQIARSGGSPKELAAAGGNIARAFAEAPVGGALVENLWRGNKFLREYSKPGTTNAELARVVDAAVAGGARVRMDTFYKTGAVNSLFEALKSGNYAGAVLRAPFALAETAAKPLMEYAVPRMKLGIISQNLEYELSKLPKEATRDDVRKISARIVDSVDNRMGQMIYDNLFWNKALKDGLMASVRSVGWNLGDIREIGGGMLDTVTAPKRAYDSLTKGSKIADNPVVTKRMTYVVALPLMVGVLGSIYQYLMTGESPKDLQDVFMPRTGRMKPDGSPERVMLPTYMKDIAPLALAATREGTVGLVKRTYSMALNKLHPAITTVGQMLHNQDYYGNQIRNADDDLVTTVQKEAAFVAKNFRPFSVQGISQREGGLKEKGQAVIGIMPAPHELTDTPAMRLIHDINLSKRPAGGYTAEQQQKRDDKRRAQQGEDLRPEIFKRLSQEEKAKVMAVATPEERDIFAAAGKRAHTPFKIREKRAK